MASTVFHEQFDFIANGEPVDDNVSNRATRQAAANSLYLKSIIDTILAGETVIARERTIKSDLEEGQPVYFNAQTLRYEAAIGQIALDATTNTLSTGPASYVSGIVYRKQSATLADILVYGVAEVSLANALAEDVSSGVLYLSNATPGRLTATRPPSGISVLSVLREGADSRWEVYVNTTFPDFLSSHSHARYELIAAPAGDTSPPVEGSPHTITNEDEDLEGWLPADHAVFAGTAPAGARFGYNISASPLRQIWPPVPVHHAVLELCKPPIDPPDGFRRDYFGFQRVPPELVTINADGIWWMTDCYNEVPWPTLLDTAAETSESASLGCPASLDVRIVLWYSSVLFATNNTAVLSLVGREGSGLKFYCPGTDDERSVGPLEADLDLDLLVGGPADTGYLVLKNLAVDPDTGKNTFLRGPVVESIVSSSPELVVTSSVAKDDAGRAYGRISLSAVLQIDGTDLAVDTVRLDGVEQEFYEETLALSFSASRTASFRGRVKVPTRVSLASGTQMRFRFWLMGRTAGSVPSDAFTLSYRRLSRPDAVLTDKVALPTSDTALTFATNTTIASPNEYYEAQSSAFDVATGDVILFTLSRAGSDGYGGAIHVLRMEGVLISP